MRLFIAIELDKEMKEYIQALQEAVKWYSSSGNFSRPENFHLTLRFIGEVGEDQKNRIIKAIDQTADKSKPFAVNLSRLGHFPRNNKKIIWLGIQQTDNQLSNLVSALEEALLTQGYPKEQRKFNAHVTLARETVIQENFHVLQQKIQVDPKVIPIEKISLMESIRVNGKLIYRPIYVKPI